MSNQPASQQSSQPQPLHPDQTLEYYLNALNQVNPLTNLEQTIRRHWQQHRPRMYQELEQSGQLEQAIQTASALTKEATYQMVYDLGITLYEAWAEVRHQWAILPSEEEQPELGTNPADWEMPEEPDEED